MLILKRHDGQWISIRHRSRDVLMIRTYELVGPCHSPRGYSPGRVNLACHDPDRNFEIERVSRFEPMRQKSGRDAKCVPQNE
jgi:hypothetical protein